MESLIAGLLKEFEDGKMTRRQLIQSLALAAAAAAPGSTVAAQSASTIPPATAPAPWKTVWLAHISYTVADYKKSAAFYRDLMGWEIKNDTGTNQCTLKIGNVGQIIIRNSRQRGANPQPTQPGRPALTGVIDHVAWGIEPWNTEVVEAELKRRGLNPRPDMVGEKSFHVLDPDGFDLQISDQNGKNGG